MKNKKFFEISDELMNSIISTAYGDAGFFERMRIHKLAARHTEVRELLNEYTATAKSVHSIKSDDCPESVLIKAKEATKIDNKSSSMLYDIYAALFTRPAVSAFAAVVLTAVLVLSVTLNDGSYNGYTQAEIEQANQQARQALALVSNIFNKTEDSIKKDILVEKISRPINEGVTTVNNLFIDKENKNEN